MNITREDMEGRQVALTIELEPETVNTALDRAYHQMVNQVDIPGFRRGKAPRYMLERYVGSDVLTERAVRNILPQTLQDAISAQDIDALDVGEVEIVSMEPVTVKVVIVQRPVVKLGDYGSIRVEREHTEVTPEQVDEVLTELRRDSAPWNEPAEPRPIKEGDMVYVNLEGFTTAGEMEDAKRENFPTIVGMERAGVPQVVNEALTGMNVGDEKDVTETFPDDFPVEDMRGTVASYHVTALSMKEQQLPELTDEYAKTLGFDTVEKLRETVERNLKERAEEADESNQINKAIAELVEGSTVEAPDLLVKEELDAMFKRLEDRLKEQRLAVRQYLSFNGISEDQWREANREQALNRVTRGLVLQEFASREGISVDEDEVEGEIQETLERFEGQEKERARSVLAQHDTVHELEDRIYQRKIVDRLVGIAEGKIEAAPAPEGEEAPAEEASEESTEEVTARASALEEAGGAAEVLGTGDIELESENVTGDAPDGGTPETAPALESESPQA